MNSVVSISNGRVRLSDADLHRAACKAIYEGNHIVFESLPSLVRQIIEHKTWRTFNKSSFADYALGATSNGLGVDTNQRLWMLRCAMDVHGDHIKEWADVLAKIEEMVRFEAKDDGRQIESFRGNSLEELAKDPHNVVRKITYLPSKQNAHDGHLVRLRKNKPDVFKRVVNGELTMVEARRKAGMKVGHHTNLGRAQSAFRMMTVRERRDFISWLKEKRYLE
jgi:hypothetical protein